MNITIIETEDKDTIKRITIYLTAMGCEFIVKPRQETEAGSFIHGTMFLVFCSRTNHELYTLWYRLRLEERNIFEIRGVANPGCTAARGEGTTNVKSCYHGVLFNTSKSGDIGG